MSDVLKVANAAVRLLSPAAPAVVRLVSQRSPDVERLRRAVETDPVLTVKVINHANHSFYARQVPVADLRRALVRLGWETTRELLLRLVMEAAIQRAGGPQATRIWTEATRVAALCRITARTAGGVDPGMTFTTGLVHSIGQLGLLAIHQERYAKLVDTARSGAHLARRERDRFGFDHARVGSGVLRSLSVPEEIANAVRRQYRANLAERPWPDASLLMAAHLQLSHRLLYDDGEGMADPSWVVRQPLAVRLGLTLTDVEDLPARLDTALGRMLEAPA